MELGKSLFAVGESKYLPFFYTDKEYHLLLEIKNCAESHMGKAILDVNHSRL